MGLRTDLTRLFAGEAGVRALKSRRARKILDLPDRRLLAEAYIPAFAAEGGVILWVGCRAYTADDYSALEAHGAEVWTTDIDPEAARWSREGRHRTGDVCEADSLFGDMMFDAIICNGVLGFGVDAPDQQERALRALSRILRPGGRLLLGWNLDKIADPIAAGLTAPWFERAAFAGQPERVTFAETTHVYDALIRRAADD
jgi:SAM-dependent methyltransferase